MAICLKCGEIIADQEANNHICTETETSFNVNRRLKKFLNKIKEKGLITQVELDQILA